MGYAKSRTSAYSRLEWNAGKTWDSGLESGWMDMPEIVDILLFEYVDCLCCPGVDLGVTWVLRRGNPVRLGGE